MKALLTLACLLACSAVHASGVYTITSRVAITGPDSFGVLQPGTYPATYGVAASTPLASVSITGDAQFSLVAPCVGQSSCVATLSLTAALGGDYVTTLRGASSTVGRARATSTTKLISAHVVGANYSLLGTAASSNPSVATFVLTSTGEIPLNITSIVGGDWVDSTGVLQNSGRVTFVHDCPSVVGPGAGCHITVTFNAAAIESDAGYYRALAAVQVTGNTRAQPAATTALYIPLN